MRYQKCDLLDIKYKIIIKVLNRIRNKYRIILKLLYITY